MLALPSSALVTSLSRGLKLFGLMVTMIHTTTKSTVYIVLQSTPTQRFDSSIANDARDDDIQQGQLYDVK